MQGHIMPQPLCKRAPEGPNSGDQLPASSPWVGGAMQAFMRALKIESGSSPAAANKVPLMRELDIASSLLPRTRQQDRAPAGHDII
jgi:hypothetical protein